MEFDDNLNPIRPNSENQPPTPPTPPVQNQNWAPTPSPAPQPSPVTPPTPPTPTPLTPPKRTATFGGFRNQSPVGLLMAGVIGLVVLIIAGFFIAGDRNAPTVNNQTANQTQGLSVSAEGLVYATPDIAKLRFGVQQVGREATVVEDEIAKKIDVIKSKIKELGVEEKDIKTAEFGIYPDYGNYPATTSQIRSYNGRHILEVTVRDLSKADAVADAVISAGANEVQNIYYTVEDPDQWYQDARSQAITKAKEKATQLAKDADIKLGRLLSINESGDQPVFYDRAMGMGGGSEFQPGLEPGSLEIRANVTLVYQIR